MTTITATAIPAGRRAAGSHRELRGIVRGIRSQWIKQQPRLTVADLDDRTLRDIGLDPAHVKRSRGVGRDGLPATTTGR